MRNTVSRIHRGLAWVVVAAIVAQFFFAGLGLFGAASFQAHKTTGYLIMLASLVLLVLALIGRLGGLRIGLSALLVVLAVVQTMLTRGPSLVAALHPLNALAVLGVAVSLARYGARSGADANRATAVIWHRMRRLSGMKAKMVHRKE